MVNADILLKKDKKYKFPRWPETIPISIYFGVTCKTPNIFSFVIVMYVVLYVNGESGNATLVLNICV